MKKIMFNDACGLTQATIEGRKTMTRRLEFNDVQERCLYDAVRLGYPITVEDNHVVFYDEEGELLFAKPTSYKVGEIVAVAECYFWVRNFVIGEDYDETLSDAYGIEDFSDVVDLAGWANKMFVKSELMPHRIRITGIKVERLQDISDEDCMAEGIFEDGGDDAFMPHYFYGYPNNKGNGFNTPREAFASLIDKVSGRGTWASNPWVVAYEYELVK